jgi:hypothetical protein
MGADQSVRARFTAAAPNTKINKAKINPSKGKATFKFKAIGMATRFQCELRQKHAHKKAKSKPAAQKHTCA